MVFPASDRKGTIVALIRLPPFLGISIIGIAGRRGDRMVSVGVSRRDYRQATLSSRLISET